MTLVNKYNEGSFLCLQNVLGTALATQKCIMFSSKIFKQKNHEKHNLNI